MFMYVVKKSIKDFINFFKFYFMFFLILTPSLYSLAKETNADIIMTIIFALIFLLLVFIICEIWFYKRNTGYKSECDYYRELPRDYSPSMVSYLLNLRSEFKKDIIADLIFLEQRKIIRIENNKDITILNNNVEWKESEHHLKYIIDVIIPHYENIEKISKLSKRKISSNENPILLSNSSSGKVDKQDYQTIRDLLNSNMDTAEIRKQMEEYITKRAEMIENGDLSDVEHKRVDKNIEITHKYQKLIVKDLKACDLVCDVKTQSLMKKSAIVLVLCLIIMVIDSLIRGMSLMFFSLFITYFLGFFLVLMITEKFKYVRTKKGKQDVALWLSYYKFLNDFSVMHSRNLEEKSLWGYYFAYGLSLGISRKVIGKFNLEHEKDIIK